MSRQDLTAVRYTSALLLTFLITASLLANITFPPHSLPTQQHHDGDPIPDPEGGTVHALAELAKKSFSDLWAYYAPYYPAAQFQESTRTDKGCVVSQVNIVSHRATPQSILTQFTSSNVTAPDTLLLERQRRSSLHLQSYRLSRTIMTPN